MLPPTLPTPVAILLMCLFSSFSSVSALPAGFIDEGVVSEDSIITGAFAPNPRNNNKPMLLLSTKNGGIYVAEDPDNSEDVVEIVDLKSAMCNNGERGLQSMEPHPKFAENQYLYLFYSVAVPDCPESVTTGPPNRVSRFKMNSDTLMIDLSSEFIILETSPSPKKQHNGGSMSFGVDGYLYITTGDGGLREPAYSQDLTNLYGSIIRVDENGDAPDTNPFTIASGGTGVPCGKSGTGRPPSGSSIDAVCEEIYAYGLRNPFRLTMNPNSVQRVEYTIGDVGASVWEELSIGGHNHSGVNYGWPKYEGPCDRGAKDVGCLDGDKSHVAPYYYYIHTELEEGGCVTGSAFVPAKSGWPEKYQFLFIDFVFETIYNLIEAPNEECRTCKPPIPGYINETFYTREVMVDMFFGPYKDVQALYVISRGDGQSIRRIRYTGNQNSAPVANFTVKAEADINEILLFDGSGSFDADGDDIKFLWDFGDGIESTQMRANHTYKEYGQYAAKLTVTDTLGQTNQAQTTIMVGIPPTAIMHFPLIDSRFAVGQVLTVFGEANDAFGVALNDTQFSWEVRQHHSEHYHPFLDRQVGVGNLFKLDPAPSPEDLSASENSYLEIIMYATDSYGLETNISRIIEPKKVFITIDSSPRGMKVLVDEYPVTTPKNITSWENHTLRLNVMDQNNLIFENWSVGGERKTNYTVPARNLTNPTISVRFTSTVPTIAPVVKPSPATKKPTQTPATKKPSQKPTGKPIADIFATNSPSESSILEIDSPPISTDTPILSPSSEDPESDAITEDDEINLSIRSNAASLHSYLMQLCAFILLISLCAEL